MKKKYLIVVLLCFCLTVAFGQEITNEKALEELKQTRYELERLNPENFPGFPMRKWSALRIRHTDFFNPKTIKQFNDTVRQMVAELNVLFNKSYESIDTYNTKIEAYVSSQFNLKLAIGTNNVKLKNEADKEIIKHSFYKPIYENRVKQILSLPMKFDTELDNIEATEPTEPEYNVFLEGRYKSQLEKEMKTKLELEHLPIGGVQILTNVLPNDEQKKISITKSVPIESDIYSIVKKNDKYGIICSGVRFSESVQIIFPVFDSIQIIECGNKSVSKIEKIEDGTSNNNYKVIHKKINTDILFLVKYENQSGVLNRFGEFICLPVFEKIDFLLSHTDSISNIICDLDGEDCNRENNPDELFFVSTIKNNKYIFKYKDEFNYSLFPVESVIDYYSLFYPNKLKIEKTEQISDNYESFKSDKKFGLLKEGEFISPSVFTSAQLNTAYDEALELNLNDLVFYYYGKNFIKKQNDGLNEDWDKIQPTDGNRTKELVLYNESEFWFKNIGPLQAINKLNDNLYQCTFRNKNFKFYNYRGLFIEIPKN